MAYYNPHLKKWFKSNTTSNRAEAGIRNWRKNQKRDTGAIATLILLFIEIDFSIPGPTNVAWMLVDILAKNGGGLALLEWPFKILCNLIGLYSTWMTIRYIKKQFAKRNF